MRRVRRERVHVPVAPPCADSGHEAHELDEDLIAVEPGQASVELLDRALPLLLRQPVEEVRMDLLHLLGEMTQVSADSLGCAPPAGEADAEDAATTAAPTMAAAVRRSFTCRM